MTARQRYRRWGIRHPHWRYAVTSTLASLPVNMLLFLAAAALLHPVPVY
jgi:hypothetical protein